MKRGAPDHPKVYEFAEALGVGRPTAIGYLELLFHFTAIYAPEGNIGKYSDKRIAAGLDWHGSPERLLKSLTTSGWIDADPLHRWVVHDWADHLDRSTRQRLTRNGREPVKSNQQDTGKVWKNRDQVGINVIPNPVPVPEPVPVVEPVPYVSTHTEALGVVEPDSDWETFRCACSDRRAFAGATEKDWAKAGGEWKFLELDQKLAAVRDIRVRDPDAVEVRAPALPATYLRGAKWGRGHVAPRNGGKPANAHQDTRAKAALRFGKFTGEIP